MKHLRIAGLCLVAVFVMSAVMTGSASAEETKPYFEQCQKVLETTGPEGPAGHWEPGCTTVKSQGEWERVLGGNTICRQTQEALAGNYTAFPCNAGQKTAKHREGNFIKLLEPVETFSSVSGEGFLETEKGHRITCTKDKDEGEITGPKTVGKVFVTFTGCKEEKGNECGTAGVIKTNELEGRLGYLEKGASPPKVGLRLNPVGTLFAEFKCSVALTVKVKGAIIGRATEVNKMEKKGALSFKVVAGKKGVQEWTKFETGEEAILKSVFTGGGEETSAIESQDTLEFQDNTQIVA